MISHAVSTRRGQWTSLAVRLLTILGIVLLVLGIGYFRHSDFRALPQQLINGLLLGAIYSLVALGYTMVYGVLRLINFAHGEVFMVGAFTALFTSWTMGFVSGMAPDKVGTPGNLVVMLVICMAVCGVMGVLIEIFAYRPMRNEPRIASLITAIGVSLLLQHASPLFFPVSPPPSVNGKVNPYSASIEWYWVKPSPSATAASAQADALVKASEAALDQARKSNAPEIEQDRLRNARNEADQAANKARAKVSEETLLVTMPQGQVIMFGTTVVLMLMLTYLVMFTTVGRAMRAVSHDFDTAALMGISVSLIVSFTFFVGSSLAGAGAMMQATFFGTPLTAQYGVTPGLKAFVAAVLGGIGNIPGAVLGGLLMGVAETLVAWYDLSAYRDAIAFIVLIIVLLFKPGGLLGSAKVEKV